MDLANLMGLIGGMFLYRLAYLKTMVPLRAAAIASNFFFVGYGLLAKALPTFFFTSCCFRQLRASLPDVAIDQKG